VIHDLDSESALDPARVGAKAAWLARAGQAGLPVLPGLVVDCAASLEHMTLGAENLATRGSGGARLAMTATPAPHADELVARGRRLGEVLVARSSTLLEASGEWSGAFTSYLDVSPEDLPRAVTGCWASAFSVAALDRQVVAGIELGSFAMSVLVQPALDPDAGGTARLEGDGTVAVTGVKGSPAPLLQGWARGHTGPDLADLIGHDPLDEVAAILRQAEESVGSNHCEWALDDGQVWVLQLGRAAPAEPPTITPGPIDPGLIGLARTLARNGDHKVLGNDDGAIRRGVRPWEPFIASVVLGNGDRIQGTPASAGVGAGVMARPHGEPSAPFPPRGVIVAGQPIPGLAPLLWDAAAIVTETGSPAAHLFESARALRVPAVCGVAIPPGDWIVAVDGQDGVVAIIPLHGEDDV
jgi:hypothetical protein